MAHCYCWFTFTLLLKSTHLTSPHLTSRVKTVVNMQIWNRNGFGFLINQNWLLHNDSPMPYKHLFCQKYSLTRLSIITFAWVVATCFGSSLPSCNEQGRSGQIPKQSSQLALIKSENENKSLLRNEIKENNSQIDMISTIPIAITIIIL